MAVIGGGMITHDQILPSLYQLQRLGVVGEIDVCAQRASTVERLRASTVIRQAFPGHRFRAFPEFGEQPQPALYQQVIAQLPANSLVVVAVPDHLHFAVAMAALQAGQHVIVVKPLVMTVAEAEQIEREARARGLLVTVEYHKRFDDRSLMARRRYRQGMFGEFRLGTAHLMEKWYYRHSNFQNWCTVDQSDAFCYIGCHYVDLVVFITGLMPRQVSVYGIKDQYPNGSEGYLYTDARIVFHNGAILNVQNSLSVPDAMPGTNTQGMTLYFAQGGRGGFLKHSDQYRGMEYCYVERPEGEGATTYTEPSPDYMQYVHLGGDGLTPVGYGYRSMEALVKAAWRVAAIPDLDERRAAIATIDAEGVLATVSNSRYNEALMEAARKSILNGGIAVEVSS